MDRKTFEKGLEVRQAVLGKEYVESSFRNVDEFNRPLQELVTEYCWGAVWGREGLPRKTRSMLNLAILSVLNRPHELKIHIQGALRNGVSREQIRETFLQVAIYAGVPRMSGQLVLATSTQRPVISTTRTLVRLIRQEVRDLVARGKWMPQTQTVAAQ
jgi:4-carboxymuconolactone decarboxylase